MPPSSLTFSLTLLLAVLLTACLVDDGTVLPPEPPPDSTNQPIILYSGGGSATAAEAEAPFDDGPDAWPAPRKSNLQDPATSLNLCQLPQTVLLDHEGYPSVEITVINKHPVPVSVRVRVGLDTVNERFYPEANLMGVVDISGEFETEVPVIEPGESRTVKVTGFQKRTTAMVSGRISLVCLFGVKHYDGMSKEIGRYGFTQIGKITQLPSDRNAYEIEVTPQWPSLHK